MTSCRAIAPVAAVLAVLVFATAFLASAASARVSAVGLLDYKRKPFKVGEWVRYRVDVSTDQGLEDANLQEVRVVGEDVYRGEKCFWVETWYGPDSLKASYDLALVSFDVFKDPDPDLYYQLYVRMVLFGLDDEGIPEMVELKPASTAAKRPDLLSLRGRTDSLGVEQVTTDRGAIDANVFELKRKIQNPRQMADSTVNRITDMTRKMWRSAKVPLTSLVKETEVNHRLIQSYAVGQPSTSAPELPLNSLFRTATVVDWGTGAKSEMLTTWRKHRGFVRPNSMGPNGGALEDATPP